jgi:hypothetical protein
LKLQWISILFILLILIVFEMVIYMLYLIIKALRTYINRNSKTNSEELAKEKIRKSLKGVVIVAVSNVLIIIAILATVYIQRNHDIYYTENVIICQSNSDVKEFTELLDEKEIDYKILEGTRVKLKNRNDFLDAENIIKENSINFSIVTIEQ